MRTTVLVIGSGLMGSGIAACSALAGNPTVLIDLELALAQKGRAQALVCIDELYTNELAGKQQAERAQELLTADTDYKKYVDSAVMVIEAIVENLSIKQTLFQQMDAVFLPEVPLLSNTSGLRITDIAALTVYPQRCVTTHFWFPAHLVPLVEVVVGDSTDAALAAGVRDTLLTWDKSAVLVKRDLPGQLANRILQAVIREAIHIVEIGLATPDDVDTAIKAGMGIRLPVWGPLEHIEAVGLDLGLKVQQTVLPEISGSATASPYLEKLVRENHLGCKTGSGFYDWSIKDMDKLAKTRNQFIIEARKFMKKQ
ncbi:MAG: 3-hydroxyacyl-CoA dehydrogenase family protein [Ruthenibacterium sp.]